VYRTTFFFKNAQQGWSETLYRNNPFGPSDTIFLQSYINSRLQLLATTCSLIGVRTSNLDSKRDISILDLPTIGRGGVWAYGGNATSEVPGLPTETEDTFTALLLRLSDGQQNYRSFPLLGLPDHIIQYNAVVPGEEALLKNRLNNWIGSMTAASLGGKFQLGTTVSGRISVFSPKVPDNQLVCLGLRGGIPPAGSLVTLNGVKPWRLLNRTWRVSSTTPGDDEADGYIYLSNSDKLNTFGPVQGGTYKSSTYQVNVLNSYTISRVTSRKTGVPFNTVRGRRSGSAR